jgi:hypothetical protein
MRMHRPQTEAMGLRRLALQQLLLLSACQAQHQECSFPAHRVSCTDCAGVACVWPMPQRQMLQHDVPAQRVELPPTFAFKDCSLDTAGGTCPPELLAAMARYTRIVLLAGLPAVGPLAFAASVHIAAAPKQMLLGTDESYTLSLTNDGVTIDAATQFGAMRALESFSQLVRWTTAVSDGHSTQRYTVPVPLKIVDAPRFTWRGLLIDSSRHFLPVPTILRTLDAMSYAKLNTLHWHVLDDCAWPIISNAFPNFTAAAVGPTLPTGSNR